MEPLHHQWLHARRQQQQYMVDKHWRVGRVVTFEHCTEQYRCEAGSDPFDDREAWGCVHQALMGEVLEVNGGAWATVRLLDDYVRGNHMPGITEYLVEEHQQIICVPMLHAVASMCATRYRQVDAREQFRLLLASKLEHLVFRTVWTVNTHGDPPVELYRAQRDAVTGRVAHQLVPLQEHATVDLRQPGVAKYAHFDGRTTKAAMRDNDPYNGAAIYYASRSKHGGRYGELNLHGDCKFRGSGDDDDNQRYELKQPFVAPQRHQILCGEVRVNAKGLYYKRWFISSPQFLYLATMLRRGYSVDSRELILKRVDCSCYNNGEGSLLCHVYERDAISSDNLYRDIAAYVMGDSGNEPSLQVKRLIRLVNPVALYNNNNNRLALQ